jgi:hypothetical protein
MKNKMTALALAGAMAMSGCQTSQQTGTLAGGAIGAGTGALIGSAVSGGRCGRRHRRGRDRRRHGRPDRQHRESSAPSLRAMGFRPKWQPRLRSLLPLTVKVGPPSRPDGRSLALALAAIEIANGSRTKERSCRSPACAVPSHQLGDFEHEPTLGSEADASESVTEATASPQLVKHPGEQRPALSRFACNHESDFAPIPR